MSSCYTELRPAYTDEATYTVDITIEGSGSIAGQTFAAQMGYLDGPDIAGATAVVTDAAARVVTLTLPGQATAGQYVFSVRRVDNGTNLVVSYGVVELSAVIGG